MLSVVAKRSSNSPIGKDGVRLYRFRAEFFGWLLQVLGRSQRE